MTHDTIAHIATQTRKTVFFGAGIAAVVIVSIVLTAFLFLRGGEDKKDATDAVSGAKEERAKVNTSGDIAVPPIVHERGLSLIFLSDGYLSWDDFDADIQMTVDAMRATKPWSSYRRYNVYRIFSKEFDLCAVAVKDERKPVLRCDPEKLNAHLNRLSTGPFKLIVLSRREFQSWANVKRLEDSGIFFSVPVSPKDPATRAAYQVMFLHLLGHAFGLKDEEEHPIAKADSAALVPDGPNCAPDKKTAESWWGSFVADKLPGVGYHKGCAGNPEYIKPTKTSLMNLGEFSPDTSADYGPVSEAYLSKILQYCFMEKSSKTSDDPDFFSQYPEFSACVSE
ncbi:MAG: hypothetical protein AAB819_01930 [Patescibacteria group bacterium]